MHAGGKVRSAARAAIDNKPVTIPAAILAALALLGISLAAAGSTAMGEGWIIISVTVAALIGYGHWAGRRPRRIRAEEQLDRAEEQLERMAETAEDVRGMLATVVGEPAFGRPELVWDAERDA